MKAKVSFLTIILYLCSLQIVFLCSLFNGNLLANPVKSDTLTYTLSLYDDYGDGWEGEVTLKVNDDNIISGYSLSNGFGPADSTFYVTEGDNISTVYKSNGSMFAIEESYTIKDEKGIVVAEDGVNATVPAGISSYKVSLPDTNDVGPISISIPQFGIGMTSSMNVETRVKNFGVDSLNDVPLSFSCDSGNTFVNDTLWGALDSFQVGNKQLTSTIDLSSDKNYHLCVATGLDDDNKNNDTLHKTIRNFTLPYKHNFDSINKTPQHILVVNETSSGSVTLSSQEAASAPNSLCLNNSSNDNGATLIAALPIFYGNFSGRWISFDYYSEQTLDTLIVGLIPNLQDINSFIGVDTIIPSAFETWTSQYAVMPDNYSNEAHIAFMHTSRDNFSPFYIDNIYLESAPSGPIFSSEPDSLEMGTVMMNAPDTIQRGIKIYNKGTGTLNVTNLSLTGTNQSDFTIADTNTYPKELGVYEYLSVDILFSGTAKGAKNAQVDITTNTGNYAITLEGTIIDVTIDNFPWVEKFDNNEELKFGWKRYHSNGFIWETTSGQTSTANTGPLTDCKTGVGAYVYTEASQGNQGDETHLISPPLDLSTLSNPKMKFWYYMYGVDIDGLYIDAAISNDWVVIDSLKGEKQKTENYPWLLHATSLTNYTDADSIRFRVVRGGGCYGDVAIDNVAFGEGLIVDLGGDTALCKGDSLSLHPGNYTSYHWYWESTDNLIDTTSQLTIDSSGLYMLKVTDEGEFYGYDTLQLLINPNPNDVIISGPVTMDYNATASFTAEAGLGQLSYNWFNGDTTETVILDKTDVNPGHDTISVTVSNIYGCLKSQSKHIYVIDNVSGIEDEDKDEYRLYPNPSAGILNIETPKIAKETNIKILNEQGRLLRSYRIDKGNSGKTINIKDLPAGAYYMLFESEKNWSCKKIIVK
mgnify:CR=1 FL=1